MLLTLTSNLLTNVEVLLTVTLLEGCLVTVVLELAVSLLALSFFSFSNSALFGTVLVRGTRGFGDTLVKVAGLAGFGANVVLDATVV